MSDLKQPTRPIKCAYCGCISLVCLRVVPGDEGKVDHVYRCCSCKTEFSLHLETIPENQPEKKGRFK